MKNRLVLSLPAAVFLATILSVYTFAHKQMPRRALLAFKLISYNNAAESVHITIPFVSNELAFESFCRPFTQKIGLFSKRCSCFKLCLLQKSRSQTQVVLLKHSEERATLFCKRVNMTSLGLNESIKNRKNF